MQKDSFQKFKKLLKNSQNIAIVTHWSPDGDAMGSSLALYLFLFKLNKKVSVIVPNAYPDFLHWLPGNKQVINFQANEKKAEKILMSADAIFTLDFNSYKRLEKLGNILEKTEAPKVLIDHHQQPDDYPTLYFHDVDACSTCELIFDFIVGLGEKKLIDKKIAACLYTGLMTDTGSFRYPSVTHKTHLILSELLKTGIVPSDIHSAVYDNYSLDRLKLLGFALNEKLKMVPGCPVAYFTLTEKELSTFNYQKGDIEGLVNYPFSIKGIKVCALFNESEGYVKISFRSKGKIDMNLFARKYFSGGGHINAAGGKSTLSLKDTESKFVELVKELF
ncbi:DHH family phosphoesterase [Aurantibacillus circumpalustris]|uniref:DHH family phosphoesterase n=1 Tax=Aurantibacillus circumpalustris TaxID=3036359 RepID=UPI00295B422E|nr:bifunctional oligoribonuclease/PAP phosphatase NrnA [Aurantibacillus circumpalustris]